MKSVPFIGGQHGVVKFGTLRLWADRGIVHIEDSKDNVYTTISVKEALNRMQAISDMVTNTLEMKGDITRFFKALESNQEFLDQMVKVCRKAQIQGMPTDPQARKELARRRPTTVFLPTKPTLDL